MIPSKVSGATSFPGQVLQTNGPTSRKNKQSDWPLTLQGSIPPVTLITFTSAKKVTFTQTRVHKYLSARTQMDDIFQGSSLYATSLLQVLHEDKNVAAVVGIRGNWQDPPAYLAGERTGLCDKDTHTKAVQVKHELDCCRSRWFKQFEETYFVFIKVRATLAGFLHVVAT